MHLLPVEQLTLKRVEHLAPQLTSVDKPIVISGGAKTWPAMSALRLTELKKAFGDATIPVRKSDDEFSELFGSKGEHVGPRQMMKLTTYIDTILASNKDGTRPPYAGNINILGDPAVARRLGQLVSRCDFPTLSTEHSKDEYRLWIAARGQRSTIHNDPSDNFNAQIVGRKYFLIFSPDRHKLLYPSFYNLGLWVSPIDPKNADLDRFPNFNSIEGYDCWLDEGDILFIPRFWWHYAEAGTECVNVNKWVYTGTAQLAWWHQQPIARELIDYQEIIGFLRRQFDALPADLQDIRRVEFENLQADLERPENQRKLRV